jgi:hypothetical protein
MYLGDILKISGTQTSNVYVVLNGKIILRDHYFEEPFNFNVL